MTLYCEITDGREILNQFSTSESGDHFPYNFMLITLLGLLNCLLFLPHLILYGYFAFEKW